MQTIAFEGRAFVLSANQCVTRKNLPAWIKEESGSSDRRPERKQTRDFPERQVRRSSTTTKTEDNHEITWPLPEPRIPKTSGMDDLDPSSNADRDEGPTSDPMTLPKMRRQVSATTKTEDNHEITWPSSDTKAQKTSASIQHSGPIATPSPLRLTTISIDDRDDGDLNSLSPLQHLTKTLSNQLIALPASQPAPRTSSVPSDTNPSSSSGEEFVCRGGSCIISPTGAVLAGPLWEVETGGLLLATVDFEDCQRGRLDLDVAGNYSRSDAFELRVRGLDISPPP